MTPAAVRPTPAQDRGFGPLASKTAQTMAPHAITVAADAPMAQAVQPTPFVGDPAHDAFMRDMEAVGDDCAFFAAMGERQREDGIA